MSHKINTPAAFADFVQAVTQAIGKAPKWQNSTATMELAEGEPNDHNYWIWRETLRTYNSASLLHLFKPYEPVLWADAAWCNKPLHFAHVSQTDTSKIAFTPNAAKGRSDVQVRMSPGKYLEKFFLEDIINCVDEYSVSAFRAEQLAKAQDAAANGLTRDIKDYGTVSDAEIKTILAKEVIKEWVTRHKAKQEEGTVYFASTVEELIEVYSEGPNSCMSCDKEHQNVYMSNTGGIFPVTVYAGPDTVVAYTKRDGKINARTVCNISTNPPMYGRVYGDVLIKDRLQKLGFRESSAVTEGVRLLKIKVGEGSKVVRPDRSYVMPYIDGDAHRAIVDGDYITLHTNGAEMAARSQYGFIELSDTSTWVHCPYCGTLYDPANGVNTHTHGTVCGTCGNNQFVKAFINPTDVAVVPLDDTIASDYTRYWTGVSLDVFDLVQISSGQYYKRDLTAVALDGFTILRSDEDYVECVGDVFINLNDTAEIKALHVRGNRYSRQFVRGVDAIEGDELMKTFVNDIAAEFAALSNESNNGYARALRIIKAMMCYKVSEYVVENVVRIVRNV